MSHAFQRYQSIVKTFSQQIVRILLPALNAFFLYRFEKSLNRVTDGYFQPFQDSLRAIQSFQRVEVRQLFLQKYIQSGQARQLRGFIYTYTQAQLAIVHDEPAERLSAETDAQDATVTEETFEEFLLAVLRQAANELFNAPKLYDVRPEHTTADQQTENARKIDRILETALLKQLEDQVPWPVGLDPIKPSKSRPLPAARSKHHGERRDAHSSRHADEPEDREDRRSVRSESEEEDPSEDAWSEISHAESRPREDPYHSRTTTTTTRTPTISPSGRTLWATSKPHQVKPRSSKPAPSLFDDENEIAPDTSSQAADQEAKANLRAEREREALAKQQRKEQRRKIREERALRKAAKAQEPPLRSHVVDEVRDSWAATIEELTSTAGVESKRTEQRTADDQPQLLPPGVTRTADGQRGWRSQSGKWYTARRLSKGGGDGDVAWNGVLSASTAAAQGQSSSATSATNSAPPRKMREETDSNIVMQRTKSGKLRIEGRESMPRSSATASASIHAVPEEQVRDAMFKILSGKQQR